MSLYDDAGIRQPIVYSGAPSSGKTALGNEIKKNNFDIVPSNPVLSQFVDSMLNERGYSNSSFLNELNSYLLAYNKNLDKALRNGSNNLLFVEGSFVDFIAMIHFKIGKKCEILPYLYDSVKEMKNEMRISKIFFLQMPEQEYRKRLKTKHIAQAYGESWINEAVNKAIEFERMIKESYLNFGFALKEVPVGTPEKRLKIIREEISTLV